MNLKFYTILAVLLGTLSINAQTIMLVDDVKNAAVFDNIGTIITALDSADLDYFLFDAASSGTSPTIEEMEPFDLVLWYTGNDGGGLVFWNGTDTVNPAITSYLDGGGKLVLIGFDFLFDRHGSAPDTFDVDDFEYKYLGIAEYKAQSYLDDGLTGVPQFDLDPEAEGFTLSPIKFIFPTIWYADALVPTENANKIYLMGPASHPLGGEAVVISNITDTFATVSVAFDPGQINSQENINTFIKEIIASITVISTSIEEHKTPVAKANVVTRGQDVIIPLSISDNDQTIYVINAQGQIISQQKTGYTEAQIQTSTLKTGMYYAYLKGDVHRFVVVE